MKKNHFYQLPPSRGFVSISKTLLIITITLAGLMLHAAPTKTSPYDKAKTEKAVKLAYQQNLIKYKDNSDMMVAYGLLADRKEKWVRIWASAMGHGAGSAMEFFLVSNESDRDYESIALSFARPSDIHKALVFIGMSPGRPVDPSSLKLWPKGERVFMTFEWKTPPKGKNTKPKLHKVSAETLFINTKTNKPLPKKGLVFVGSEWFESKTTPGKKEYAADLFDPRSIASNYNDSLTVLDLPYQAKKSEVYSFSEMNPAYSLEKGQPLQILLEPEYKDGKLRVIDLVLNISLRKGTKGESMKDAQFFLENKSGERLCNGDKMSDMFSVFQKLNKDGKDPFITIKLDERLKLMAIKQIYALTKLAVRNGKIRLEPAAEGQLYYESFTPDEKFRERKNRPSQPWELRLTIKNGNVNGTLTRAETIWNDDGKKTFKIESFDVSSPKMFKKIMDEKDKNAMVFLVFAPGSMSYGTLLAFLKPVLQPESVVFIFLPLTNPAHK